VLFKTHHGEVSVCDYRNESRGTLFLSAAGFRMAVRVFSMHVSTLLSHFQALKGKIHTIISGTIQYNS
jgi:hypothetical protein